MATSYLTFRACYLIPDRLPFEFLVFCRVLYSLSVLCRLSGLYSLCVLYSLSVLYNLSVLYSQSVLYSLSALYNINVLYSLSTDVFSLTIKRKYSPVELPGHSLQVGEWYEFFASLSELE